MSYSQKLIGSSLEIKDPGMLTRTYTKAFTTTDRYIGEIKSTTATDTKYNIKKTIYHSQVFAKTGTTSGLIIPFFEFAPSSTSTQYDIGKIVLKISHQAGNNAASNQLFQIVGTQQSASENRDTSHLSSTLATSTETPITTTIIGDNANIYESAIFIAGQAAGTKKTYEIDFNSYLTSSATAGDLICLGLEFNQAPANESIFLIEAHVEIVEPDYGLYINTHTVS
jgi:hypothetical protein